MASKKAKIPKVALAVEGFYRVNILDNGKVVGDSGWKHNLIPSGGLTKFISQSFASSSGSTVDYIALASDQSSLASDSTALSGEYTGTKHLQVGTKQITTRASSTSGDTVRFLGIFTSNGVFQGVSTIAAIGLYAGTAASQIFCGGSFASSTLGSNQAINCTYDVVFLASTS